ncbi:NAD-dependent epimerase/dehydratase family protein [Bacillus solitudinis]|uniref:NAD-dependent epimerase/dehydratase family protein n=1 Tax=Bacillus solitudinis TaxID=2014074 RepID=UPI000C236AD3|nr:NAD(P)-dependent oxidoreductase [Bacillus solitudinis]
MKKVMVTGGLGFIGFHLCQRLLEEGIEVIAIDEMPVDRCHEQEEMQMRLGRNALFQLIENKLEDIDLSNILRNIDVVFHLAAQTKYDGKWPRLAEMIENNVKVTTKLIEACSNKTRIIFASTIEVYGERPGSITERTPTNPTSPYGITKLASEIILEKEAKKKEINYIILRLPTVYGPWQRSDMTFQKLLLGEEVDTVSVDRSILDVVYVDDVIDAFILSATSTLENEIIQISSGQSNEWYTAIEEIIGKTNRFTVKKVKATLSSEKANLMLGFQAKTTLKQGVAKQRQHMKQWHKQLGE